MTARLEGLGDDEVLELVLDQTSASFWSRAGMVLVDETPVFVKRVPLSAPEVETPYSTRNHFGLPDCYHYGVGSAGFGAYRELAGLARGTELVASGVDAGFPLLFHHRTLPGTAEPWAGRLNVEEYVEYWAGDSHVARCIAARGDATHELWMFLEPFPHVVADWLLDNQHATPAVIDGLCRAAAALRSAGFVHFDAYLANAVTDGQLVCLADFGLVSALEFELDPCERRFLDRHRYYDVGLIIAGLGHVLATGVERLTDDLRSEVKTACGIAEDTSPLGETMGLIDGVRSISGPMELSEAFVELTERYRDVNQYVHRFLFEMRSRPSKDAEYDDTELLARLREARAPGLD